MTSLGIQYDWDELVADYRLSVVRHLFRELRRDVGLSGGLGSFFAVWPHTHKMTGLGNRTWAYDILIRAKVRHRATYEKPLMKDDLRCVNVIHVTDKR